MIMEILNRCHAKPCGTPCFHLESVLDIICSDLAISKMHRAVLSCYGGAPIGFESLIKADLNSLNIENLHYDLYVDLIFGVAGGENTIELIRQKYANILPSGLIPVASSPWDDLYCIDRNGIVHFWDHEAPGFSTKTPIAETFDLFLAALWPDQTDSIEAGFGIIDSESWLDPDLPDMRTNSKLGI